MEKTLLSVSPCPRCASKDVRFRVKQKPHHLCRRCGKTWNEENDEE